MAPPAFHMEALLNTFLPATRVTPTRGTHLDFGSLGGGSRGATTKPPSPIAWGGTDALREYEPLGGGGDGGESFQKGPEYRGGGVSANLDGALVLMPSHRPPPMTRESWLRSESLDILHPKSLILNLKS
jgi:hypothetical protein